jgi:hypothetical protein
MRKIAFILLLNLPILLLAQSVAFREEPFPNRPSPGQWYFSETQHKVWIYREGEWQALPVKNCRSMEHCNNHVILKEGLTYTLADMQGNIKLRQAPLIYCLYSFVVVGARNGLDYLLNQQGDTLSAVVDNCKIYQDTLDGKRVYCFPAYSPGLERFSCAQLRNWGMMDDQGNWRIEPKFDKPFSFTRGFADVWYMGMPRRIDEAGEFVDE